MTVHRSPASLGIGMQSHTSHGYVTVRSFGDTLTMAGLIAVAKSLRTYYFGLAGGTLLAGCPASAPVGGLPSLPAAVHIEAGYIRAAVKVGDETTVANNLVTVLTTAGDTTTGAQVGIPGP